MKTRRQQGLTLIEIMIVIAILGIIAGIAWSAYDSQRLKGYRTDAIIALTTAAQEQERWRTVSGTYTTTIANVGGATSLKGKYTIAIDNADADTYQLTATATGSQLNDTNCRTFTITQTGVKTSKDSSNNASTNCWAK